MHVPGGNWWVWTAAVVAAGAAVVLYVYPPDQYAFYPHCAFYAITGLKCPGCGGLRAAHYLLHGQIAAAFQNNPLVVLFVPTAGIGLAYFGIRRRWGAPLPMIFEHPAWLWVVLGAVLGFAVVRNLA